MAWTWYTLKVFLTEEQQRQLEAIAEKQKTDTAAAFDMIMQAGMAHVINDRLAMWAKFHGIEAASGPDRRGEAAQDAQEGGQGGPAAPIGGEGGSSSSAPA